MSKTADMMRGVIEAWAGVEPEPPHRTLCELWNMGPNGQSKSCKNALPDLIDRIHSELGSDFEVQSASILVHYSVNMLVPSIRRLVIEILEQWAGAEVGSVDEKICDLWARGSGTVAECEDVLQDLLVDLRGEFGDLPHTPDDLRSLTIKSLIEDLGGNP